MPATYDVAVIGAGVFGAWSARFLRKSGAKVLLVDAYGPGNSRSSSGGESRIIRMGYGADEIYTRFAMRSLPLWKELFAETGRPELFHKTGVLWIAPDKYQYAIDSLATLQNNGVGCEQLTVRDLRRRYPQISFEDEAWGIFEPHSGVLMARRAVRAVVDQALAAGVDYRNLGIAKPSGQQQARIDRDQHRRKDLGRRVRFRLRFLAAENISRRAGLADIRNAPGNSFLRRSTGRAAVHPAGDADLALSERRILWDAGHRIARIQGSPRPARCAGRSGHPVARRQPGSGGGGQGICGAAFSGAAKCAGSRDPRLPVRKYVERRFSDRPASATRKRLVGRRRVRPRIQARAGGGRICRSAGHRKG